MKYKLLEGDCLERLKQLKGVQCIFADPPDNIGLGYDEYDDKLADASYRKLLHDWTLQFMRTAPIVWISFNAKWTFAMGQCFDSLLNAFSEWEGKACTQVFTFGQHNKHDLGNNHRPLWRLKHKDAPLYPEAIKVPSWRQRNGDKRAAPGGRVPGDVFDMQYPYGPLSVRAESGQITYTCPLEVQERGTLVKIDQPIVVDTQAGDVFDFPRVTGNSAQRCDWHPTQLHEELVERCIKLSTKDGDTVVDPFGGTGTTLRVAERLERPCTLIELDKGYCGKIVEAHKLKVCRSPGTWGK